MIISNNLVGKMPIPDEAVIRINLAWIKSYEEANKIIEKSEHPIYLDYPDGRSKPPVPTISFKEAMSLADTTNKVKFFAISNAEDPKFLLALRYALPDLEIVPKIETEEGVRILPEMVKMGITTVMLDKEDLWVNVGADSEVFNELVDEVRKSGMHVLELAGVVFI
jgi:hypothetical protein